MYSGTAADTIGKCDLCYESHPKGVENDMAKHGYVEIDGNYSR